MIGCHDTFLVYVRRNIILLLIVIHTDTKPEFSLYTKHDEVIFLFCLRIGKIG
jgi:hypothetical protein